MDPPTSVFSEKIANTYALVLLAAIVLAEEPCEKIGKLNVVQFDKSKLAGSSESSDQADPSTQSGFYGAPTVCVIFGPKNFLYSIPDAFCCADNMVLEVTELGLASCIVVRGEETFIGETGEVLLKEWEIPENYVARCFVGLLSWRVSG